MANETRSQFLRMIKQGDRVVDAAGELGVKPATAFRWAREAGLIETESGGKIHRRATGIFIPREPIGDVATEADLKRASSYVQGMLREGATGHTFAGADWWIVRMIPGLIEKVLRGE